MDLDPVFLRSIDLAFSGTEHVLITAFKVWRLKRSSDSEILQQDATSPTASRALALTLKKSQGGSSFRASMHICRPTDFANSYEVQKSVQLKYVSCVTVQPVQYDLQDRRELRFHVIHQQQDKLQRADFLLRNTEDVMFFLALMVQLLRRQDSPIPPFEGIDLNMVENWWTSHKEVVPRHMTDAASQVITPGVLLPSKGETTSVLVSAKEARDLEELLDIFAMGVGDAGEFQSRLQDELYALEAANVHAILESAPYVDAVVQQLKRTQGLLDDLDESLRVFDLKLRHMREDIAAIESCNNTLEVQSRNNNRLLMALQGLLKQLVVDPQIMAVLDSPKFTPDMLNQVVQSAESLHNKLRQMGGSHSDQRDKTYGLGDMKVVREARKDLEALAARFVGQAVDHLSELVQTLCEEMMQEGAKGSGKDAASRLRPHSRKLLHGVCRQHLPLVKVVRALKPAAMSTLQQAYVRVMNTIIRRELRTCSSELRKAALLDMQQNPIDYNLGKDKGGATGKPGKAVGRAGQSLGNGSDSYSDSGDLSMSVDSPELPTGFSGRGKARRTAIEAATDWSLPEAWQFMLDNYLPVVIGDCKFAAEFLLLTEVDTSWSGLASSRDISLMGELSSPGKARSLRGDFVDSVASTPRGTCAGGDLVPGGQQVLEALLAGIEQDVLVLVDLTVRTHQVFTIPMLAVVKKWKKKLEGQPYGAPLISLLEVCHDKLLGNFAAYMTQQTNAVEAYDSKGNLLGSGLKHLHVVPFVSQFALMVHHLESLLRECALEDGLTSTSGSFAGGSGNTSPVSSPAKSVTRTVSLGDGEDQEVIMSEHIVQVRREVDARYQEIGSRMFSSLERLAGTDQKYGERLRLENYGYFVESVRPMLQVTSAFESFHQLAETRRAQALDRYIRQQLEHGKLLRLLDFGEKLEKMLEVVSPGDVPFQGGCSLTEVRTLVKNTMEGMEKKLETMHKRVRRHLGPTSLSYTVWTQLQEQLIRRYARVQDVFLRCYPSLPLKPSADELNEMTKAVGCS